MEVRETQISQMKKKKSKEDKKLKMELNSDFFKQTESLKERCMQSLKASIRKRA